MKFSTLFLSLFWISLLWNSCLWAQSSSTKSSSTKSSSTQSSSTKNSSTNSAQQTLQQKVKTQQTLQQKVQTQQTLQQKVQTQQNKQELAEILKIMGKNAVYELEEYLKRLFGPPVTYPQSKGTNFLTGFDQILILNAQPSFDFSPKGKAPYRFVLVQTKGGETILNGNLERENTSWILDLAQRKIRLVYGQSYELSIQAKSGEQGKLQFHLSSKERIERMKSATQRLLRFQDQDQDQEKNQDQGESEDQGEDKDPDHAQEQSQSQFEGGEIHYLLGSLYSYLHYQYAAEQSFSQALDADPKNKLYKKAYQNQRESLGWK